MPIPRGRLATHGMRLLHTSDTHLGHQQYPRTAPNGLNQREQDHYDTWTALIDAAIADPPDVFIHAGDLFDGVRPSNRALAAAMDGFIRLSQAGIETIVIAGNHEHPKMRGTGSPFRLFEHLPHIHPVYKGQPETFTIQGTDFHAVPQCSDADTLRQHVTSLPKQGVLIIHGAVQTIEAFKHAEFNEQTLDADWFDGFDYVALGHYHNTTEITPRAWYCGAPDRVSIGEAGEQKGYLRVDLDGPAIEHRPLPVRTYADLPRIDASDLGAEDVLAAAQSALSRVPDGAIGRIRIDAVDPALRGSLDQRAIHAAAKHLVHLDLRIAWADKDHAVRGDLELGGLVEEFEAYAASQEIPKRREKIMALAREVLE